MNEPTTDATAPTNEDPDALHTAAWEAWCRELYAAACAHLLPEQFIDTDPRTFAASLEGVFVLLCLARRAPATSGFAFEVRDVPKKPGVTRSTECPLRVTATLLGPDGAPVPNGAISADVGLSAYVRKMTIAGSTDLVSALCWSLVMEIAKTGVPGVIRKGPFLSPTGTLITADGAPYSATTPPDPVAAALATEHAYAAAVTDGAEVDPEHAAAIADGQRADAENAAAT